jgi:SAM-dependent methyltransferase
MPDDFSWPQRPNVSRAGDGRQNAIQSIEFVHIQAGDHQSPISRRSRLGREIDTSALLPSDGEHCRQFLEPWVISAMPSTSSRWRKIIANDTRHWRVKVLKRRLKGLLSGNLSSALRYRTADHVKKTYGRTWSGESWPSPDQPLGAGKPTMAEWRDEGLILKKGGLNQMQLERMMALIATTRPRTVLEVGAGSGQNLLSLCAVFPEIAFTGIELTEEGVARAHSVQSHEQLPDVIKQFSPFPIVDGTAHLKIDFQQGDATALPFADGSFDLVYSRLALEQMERVRRKAVSEMVRVSAGHVLMVEPFADFNDDERRSLAHRAKNFFSMRLDDLPAAGLEPLFVFADWPQKISEGVCLVYCRVIAKG